MRKYHLNRFFLDCSLHRLVIVEPFEFGDFVFLLSACSSTFKQGDRSCGNNYRLLPGILNYN